MSKYREGDRFTIEIDSVFEDDSGEILYRMKGFNALTGMIGKVSED